MNRVFIRKSFIFIIITVLIKLAGVIRDIVIANYFGDSYLADAFLTAFVLVNVLILFFTNGMRHLFVPLYMKARVDHEEDKFTATIFYGTGVFSACLVLVLLVIVPLIIPILYPVQADIIINLTQILLMAVLFVAVNAVLEAYFESIQRYSISAFSQLIVLLIMIATVVLFHQQLSVYALAVGYLLGTITSFLLKLYLAIGVVGWHFSIKRTQSFYINYFPIALTVMIGQINLAVDQLFANRIGEGVVTYLSYAKNLVHLPQALIATALGTLIFPVISKAFVSEDRDQLLKTINRGQLLVLTLLIPAIAGMATLMTEIIQLLYQRGQFTPQATLATTRVAYFYLGSVFFYSFNTLIVNGLYALNKAKAIMKISLISVCLNVILNGILSYAFGFVGIPLASSIVGGLYLLLTYQKFCQEIGKLSFTGSYKQLIKVGIASLIMIIVLVSCSNLHVILQIILGVSVYLLLLVLLNLKEWKEEIKWHKK
ncbi:putative peptidoglycan lipid II flippase [Amphibacillus marinus]|uniref:Putative peptidoglycan lipid II flippase n=1 Tax=Amphibacillus marinus TaxID=872970 RepID=A0A1H8N3S3_9BACI|nr:lipid II flippase MurJ [Amphibacillus marinus]SEO24234.1 putative peptidoglycan lipid II flippase [Amphibacillus marinus]